MAVPLVCQIQPVQPAGAAVESIQFQQFVIWADVCVQAFLISEGVPFQFHVGAIMDCLRKDIKPDTQLI